MKIKTFSAFSIVLALSFFRLLRSSNTTVFSIMLELNKNSSDSYNLRSVMNAIFV
jgi:hypothetical protein